MYGKQFHDGDRASRSPFSDLVFPLVFHSIKDEIPEASQPLITRIFQLWLVLCATLVVNMVACIFILIAGADGGGSDLGSSIGCVLMKLAVILSGNACVAGK